MVIKTRTEFHVQVKQALTLAEPAIASIWGESSVSLQIVERRNVERIISAWPQVLLNWRAAVKKCDRIPRSCFIGVYAQDAAVSILAFIRLSDAHLHTNLLFTEKNTNDVPARMGMLFIDAILDVIAGAFGSKKIVLDNPVPELLAYYCEFGYEPMKKHGRERPAMFKSVIVR